MKRISEKAYPLDVWIWEQYAFSKGHHDPALFVVHLEVDHGMGIWDWYVLECGHLVSRRRSVAPDPKKMYCGKCSRAANAPIVVDPTNCRIVGGRS